MFGRALQADGALMRFGDPFHDGQPEPASPLGSRSRFVDAVEPLEDASGGFRRDADAVVGNAQLDPAFFPPQLDRDCSSVRRIFNRVVQKIDDHPAEQVFVTAKSGFIGGLEIERESFIQSQRARRMDAFLDQVVEVNLFQFEFALARVGARQ